MKLVVLANPRSGRGIARRLAADLRRLALRRGHACKVLEIGGPEPLDPDRLPGADALALIGGDGTVNRCAPAAIEAGVPIYQLPTGNENLFARALGMRRSPNAMLDAMEGGRTAMADAAVAGDRLFLIMASLGPDASVVHRVANNRRRAIGHLAYVEPILRECLGPSIPTLTVGVDGRRAVEGRRGVLVVANTREYAARLDPCPQAGLFTGRLHAVFLPARHVVDVLRWGGLAWRRRLGERAGAEAFSGQTLEVRVDSDLGFAQIDGESLGPLARGQAVSMSVRPAALRVLVGSVETFRENAQAGVRMSGAGTLRSA